MELRKRQDTTALKNKARAEKQSEVTAQIQIIEDSYKFENTVIYELYHVFVKNLTGEDSYYMNWCINNQKLFREIDDAQDDMELDEQAQPGQQRFSRRPGWGDWLSKYQKLQINGKMADDSCRFVDIAISKDFKYFYTIDLYNVLKCWCMESRKPLGIVSMMPISYNDTPMHQRLYFDQLRIANQSSGIYCREVTNDYSLGWVRYEIDQSGKILQGCVKLSMTPKFVPYANLQCLDITSDETIGIGNCLCERCSLGTIKIYDIKHFTNKNGTKKIAWKLRKEIEYLGESRIEKMIISSCEKVFFVIDSLNKIWVYSLCRSMLLKEYTEKSFPIEFILCLYDNWNAIQKKRCYSMNN